MQNTIQAVCAQIPRGAVSIRRKGNMKRNMQLKYAALMCSGALMLGLTACSSGTAKETTAAPTTAQVTETAAAESSAQETAESETSESESASAAEAESVAREALRGTDPITVKPLDSYPAIDGSLEECEFPASFDPAKDIVKDGDTYKLTYTGYGEELFDLVDMFLLQKGDTIVIGGEDVLIDSIENPDGKYLINGGLDEGGYDLVTDENTTFYVRGYDDMTTYTTLGSYTLPIAKDCVITDNSDLDNQGKILTVDELMKDDSSAEYLCYNTVITLKGGEIAGITRNYRP